MFRSRALSTPFSVTDMSPPGQVAFAAALGHKLSLTQIPALNGLRAIAVLLVILYHFGLPFPAGEGVLIFFVLSGFLITWLLLREQDRRGDISLAAFYWRRTLRIFPAFYFYWLVLVGLSLLGHKAILWPQAISALFYVGNYYNAIWGDPNTGLSHTWSLAIEEQFYLLWPMLFLRFRHDLERLTRVLTALIGAVWLYRGVLRVAFDVDQGYFYAAFDTRMDSLLVGCLLAVTLKRGTMMAVWSRLCRGGIPLVTIVLLMASASLGPMWWPAYRDVIGFAVDPLLIALLLVQVVALSGRPLFRWLDWPVLRYLGTISYSLYLWQQLVVSVTRNLPGLPLALELVIAVGGTVMVASLSYELIERPLLRWKRRVPG